MLCAVALSSIGLVLQSGILTLMNTPEQSMEGATNYATVCMVGLVFIYGYNIVSAILRGMGDSKHPFIFISIAAVLNLVLDLIFVVGFDMGAGGAALATVISQGVSFISCALFLVKNRSAFELNIGLRDFFVGTVKCWGIWSNWEHLWPLRVPQFKFLNCLSIPGSILTAWRFLLLQALPIRYPALPI